MKRPLHRSECSFPEQRLNAQQSAFSFLLSTSKYEKIYNTFFPQHHLSEMQHRNCPLRRRRRSSEWNNFTGIDRCTFNNIALHEIRRIVFGSFCVRNASCVLVILCWMIAQALPTLGQGGPSPTPFVIPRFRVEPIEYRGGIVIPAFLFIEDPEINVTPAPVTVTAPPTSKLPTSPPTRKPTTTVSPVPPTDAPTNTFTPTINTITPITKTPIIVNTASPTNTPVAVTDAPNTNSPTTEPSTNPSYAPVRSSTLHIQWCCYYNQ
jgi:hypothetical protein